MTALYESEHRPEAPYIIRGDTSGWPYEMINRPIKEGDRSFKIVLLRSPGIAKSEKRLRLGHMFRDEPGMLSDVFDQEVPDDLDRRMRISVELQSLPKVGKVMAGDFAGVALVNDFEARHDGSINHSPPKRLNPALQTQDIMSPHGLFTLSKTVHINNSN